MLRRGLSARLERHIERGGELMELNRTAHARSEAAHQRSEAAHQRSEAAFKRNEAAFDRNLQAFERLMAGFDRHEERFDAMAREREDLTVYIRDMNRRSEITFQNLMADHEMFMAKLMERIDEMDQRAEREHLKVIARLDEASEESKAHREALLALIDRLPPPPPQAA